MTDGQPLKERREAEKAELFQGTGQESHAGKENVVWRRQVWLHLDAEALFFVLEVIFWLLMSIFLQHHSLTEEYLSSTEGSFSCKWGFTPVMGRMLVDKALMV